MATLVGGLSRADNRSTTVMQEASAVYKTGSVAVYWDHQHMESVC